MQCVVPRKGNLFSVPNDSMFSEIYGTSRRGYRPPQPLGYSVVADDHCG